MAHPGDLSRARAPGPAGYLPGIRMLPALATLALAGADRLGYAFLSDDGFTVREKVTIDYVYVVGSEGLGRGDRIRVEDPVLHGARWSLYGAAQLDPSVCTPWDPADAGSFSLVTVSTTGAATVSLERVNPAGVAMDDERSETPATAVYSMVTVESGRLDPGDEVVLRYGDTSTNPDCGHELAPRALERLAWPIEVDLDGAWESVTPSPTLTTVARAEAARLWVVAPSYVEAGTPFDLHVAVLDTYGNPVTGWRGTVSVGAEWGGASHTFTSADGGVHDLSVEVLKGNTVSRIEVDAGFASGVSNPIRSFHRAFPPERFVWWGDIHVHNGHSYQDDDGAWVDDNVVYARDVVGLDVAAESMKAEPVQIRGEDNWEMVKEACASSSVDGEFIYLLATEWMGGYAEGFDVGHHNFYYDGCDAPIMSHITSSKPEGMNTFGSGAGPYEWAEARRLEGIETVIVPHATLYTGYSWSPESVDNGWRTVAEVVSGWGISLDGAGDEGSVEEGLAAGQRMGFLGASDNHDGWMGNDVNTVTVGNGGQIGLTAFVAARLDRASIFGALRDRDTYGTTGERILLDFAATENGVEVRAGRYYVAREPTFTVIANGTDTLTAIRLLALPIRGGAQVEVLNTWYPEDLDYEGSWTWYDWDGGEHAVWVEVEQPARASALPGEYAWSSPIWVTRDCRGDAEDLAGNCAGDSADSGGDPGSESPDSASADSGGPDSTPLGETGREVPGARCACGVAGTASGAYGWLLLGLVLARRRR